MLMSTSNTVRPFLGSSFARRIESDSNTEGHDEGPLRSSNKHTRIRTELSELPGANNPTVYFGTTLLAGVVVYIFWPVVPHTFLLGWLSYMGVVIAGQYLLVLSYRRKGSGGQKLGHWRGWYINACLIAIGWGAAGAFLFQSDSIPHQSLITMVLATASAAAVPVLWSTKQALRVFLLCSLTPLTMRLLIFADDIHIAMAGMIVVVAVLILKLGGQLHAALTSALNLRYENNDLIRDLTIGKRDLEEVNNKLRFEINDRERVEKELIQAKEAAEQATRVKSQFLATMSHEIRTPMNGVMGMTELLLNTELTDKQRGFVGTIRHSGEALLAVINDILDFSKIEAGKLELHMSAFDLRQLLEDTVELFAESAHRKGLKLALIYPEGGHTAFLGDKNRIRQVLINLLGNAIKFTHQGEVVVHTHLLEDKTENVLFRFEVVDTGIGIRLEAQGHIFEPFTQADGSATRKYGGTGLGLAICKQLTQLMGGEIGVRSKHGQGSTFWFTLSLAKESPDNVQEVQPGVGRLKEARVLGVDDEAAHEQSPSAPASAADRAGAPRMCFRGRILVAEDSPVNQEVVVRMLECLGCVVRAVENGIQAVEAIIPSPLEPAPEPYKLVLMDCQMPYMDGFEATAEIRRREQRYGAIKRIPIIALTANAMEGDREKCLAAGMDDYLCKPFSEQQLSEVLQRWLPLLGSPRGSEAVLRCTDAPADSRANGSAAPCRDAASAHLDRAALEMIRRVQREGQPNILARVINLYLEDTPKLMQSIKEAMSQRDAAKLQYAAHSLKSSSARLGAQTLAAICKDLEDMGRNNSTGEVASTLSVLEFEYETTCRALVAELSQEIDAPPNLIAQVA